MPRQSELARNKLYLLRDVSAIRHGVLGHDTCDDEAHAGRSQSTNVHPYSLRFPYCSAAGMTWRRSSPSTGRDGSAATQHAADQDVCPTNPVDTVVEPEGQRDLVPTPAAWFRIGGPASEGSARLDVQCPRRTGLVKAVLSGRDRRAPATERKRYIFQI